MVRVIRSVREVRMVRGSVGMTTTPMASRTRSENAKALDRTVLGVEGAYLDSRWMMGPLVRALVRVFRLVLSMVAMIAVVLFLAFVRVAVMGGMWTGEVDVDLDVVSRGFCRFNGDIANDRAPSKDLDLVGYGGQVITERGRPGIKVLLIEDKPCRIFLQMAAGEFNIRVLVGEESIKIAPIGVKSTPRNESFE
jgi:hypothetical protein